MAKFCPNCGQMSDDSAFVCASCGTPFNNDDQRTVAAGADGSQYSYPTPDPAPSYPSYSAPSYGSPAQPADSSYYGGYPSQPSYGAPDPEPKKSKKILIIAIIAAVLALIIAGVVLFLVLNDKDDDNKDKKEDSSSETDPTEPEEESLEGTYIWTYWVNSAGSTFNRNKLESEFSGLVSLEVDSNNHGTITFPSGNTDTLTFRPSDHTVTGYKYGDTYEIDGDVIIITDSEKEGYTEEYTVASASDLETLEEQKNSDSIEGTYVWTYWVTSNGTIYNQSKLDSAFNGSVILTIDSNNKGTIKFPSGTTYTMTFNPSTHKISGYDWGDTYEISGNKIVITDSTKAGYKEEYTDSANVTISEGGGSNSLAGTYEWTYWVNSAGKSYTTGDLEEAFEGTTTLTIDSNNKGTVKFPSGHEDTLTFNPGSGTISNYKYGDTYEISGNKLIITNSENSGYREEYTRK